MTRINPFYGGRAGMLPDHMLGKNYDIVKAVYNNLDLLKEFMSDPNAEFIKDNFDDIKDILALGPDIKDIADNKDEILNARIYVNSASGSAELAKKWASKDDLPVSGTDYSAKYYAIFAREQANRAENLKNQVDLLEPDLSTVADNVNDVHTNAAYIDKIHIVGSDLSGLRQQIPIPDMGMVGSKDPNFSTESILASLVVNYKIFVDIHNNMQKLLELQHNIEITPTVDQVTSLLANCKEQLNLIESVQQNINKDVEKAVKAVDEINLLKISTINAIKDEVNAQTAILEEYTKEIESILEQVNTYRLECEGYRDECILALNKIKEILAEAKQDIQSEYEKLLAIYILKMQQEGDRQVARIEDAFEDTVDKTVAEATQKIIENLEPIKQQIINDINIELDKTEQSVKVAIQQAGQIVVNEVIDEGTKQKSEIKTQGDAQITKATQQALAAEQSAKDANLSATNAKSSADRAKSLVDSLGRPDWNNNSPGTPGYINNKPDIYTKSEIESKFIPSDLGMVGE